MRRGLDCTVSPRDARSVDSGANSTRAEVPLQGVARGIDFGDARWRFRLLLCDLYGRESECIAAGDSLYEAYHSNVNWMEYELRAGEVLGIAEGGTD